MLESVRWMRYNRGRRNLRGGCIIIRKDGVCAADAL